MLSACSSLPLLALAGGAELGAQVGEQQRAKGGVGGNQLLHRVARQRVGHHLLGGDEAAAGLARHQAATVEAVVGPVGGGQLLAVELVDVTLDDDEQMRGHGIAHVQNHFARAEIDHVHVVAHQALLVLRQAVERRGG
jgi:hypothetical protein